MIGKPNIIIIMTDQQRADFFGSEGFALDTMPKLERRSRNGRRFRKAYTPTPICMPARTSLWTGRYPKAHGIRENADASATAISDLSLADVLHAQGYSVDLIGKNHSHLGRAAFDHYSPYTHTAGPKDLHKDGDAAFEDYLAKLDNGVADQPSPHALEHQLCYRISDEAIAYLEAPKQAPFCLWLSYPEPHNPYQVPEPYYSLFDRDAVGDRFGDPSTSVSRGDQWRWLAELIEAKQPGYDEAWRNYRAVYCGMLRMLDDQLDRVFSAIESSNLHRNTIILYMSDHGDFAGDYGLVRKGAGLPECLVRIPMMVWAPDCPRVDDDTHCISIVDIMTTLCEAVGAPIPNGVMGRSFLPLLSGGTVPEDEFDSVYCETGIGGLPYHHGDRPAAHFDYEGPSFFECSSGTLSGSMKSVRKGKYKLVVGTTTAAELYDLEHDPGELCDIAGQAEMAEIKAAMLERLAQWQLRTDETLLQGRSRAKIPEHGWYWT